jgi:hypothetical protein
MVGSKSKPPSLNQTVKLSHADEGGTARSLRIYSPEWFEATKEETILGIRSAMTSPCIRVPGRFYRYHVDARSRCKVLVKDKTVYRHYATT